MKQDRRFKNKLKIRQKIFGTAERPRLTVFKSLRCLYAQLIDDSNGTTICSGYSRDRNIASAVKLAEDLSKKIKAKKVSKVVFDRNGYQYQGIVKSFADHLREQGVVI